MKNNYKNKIKSIKYFEESRNIEEICCQEPILSIKEGTIVCMNCGTVKGENFVGQEKRAYSFKEINERQQNSPRWREFGPRTIISSSNIDSRGNAIDAKGRTLFSRLSKIQNSLISSIERNFWEAKPKLNLLASKMSIPEYIKETSWKIYSLVAKKKLTMGRSIDGFLAASLYAAIRVHEFPRLLEDVSDASMIERHTVIRSLAIITREILPELSLTYKPISAEQLIFKFGNELKMPMEIQKEAINMLIKAKKKGIPHIGKDPRGLAASVIYIAARKTPNRKTQTEIAQLAKITEVTLRNRINDMKNKI
ncbi:MAG: transcription initiation factor IIB family protein [Candidatus Hermodarchaeota archaeon]